MKKRPEFLNYFLEDCLRGDSCYTCKFMFGGYGIYKYKQIFAIFVDDQIYFKVGENNLQDYLDYSSEAFRYTKKGGVIGVMSYYTLPEEIMENYEELHTWIERSLAVPVSKKNQKTNPLDIKILKYLQTIPEGKVSTYKILADHFGVHPRKIASVMKYNKEPYIYPCYKVVAHSGKVSGYNTHRGMSEKIEKLEAEGIIIKNNRIDSKYYYWG